MMSPAQQNCWQAAKEFPFMPEGEGPPTELLKQEVSDTVIFYGGTFDPWHPGHRACLDLCPTGPIVVVPDNNPHKTPRRGDPWKFFLNLKRQLAQTPHSVYPGFLANERPTPTVDWLPQVPVKHKGLLMGDDNFLTLERWKDWERLMQALTFLYAVPRGGNPGELAVMKERLGEINDRLAVTFLAHHDYEDYSSSGMRGGQA